MQKLPVGIQTFSEIREEGYVYVDKTKYILELTEYARVNFLARPRCFGKSLLVSTLKELFEGNKKLFEGLYIYDKWGWEEEYPVIHIDLAGGIYNNLNDLENKLKDIINRIARDFQVNIYSESLDEKFTDLISEISKKTDKKVVVLVDEYDKPIISNLQNKNLEEIQSELGSFYEVLKTNDHYIKFIFLTGVSQFAHVSVFSKLNSLDDLTLIDKFNSICGYTQEELEDNFQPFIQKLADEFNMTYLETLERIKVYYNGYSWNGKERVYNPYSTLLSFKHGKFSKSWFKTGTPRVLANYPMNRYNIKAVVEPSEISDDELENLTINDIKDEVLLFQTGYLTVDKIETNDDGDLYHLKIPNYEVKTALFKNLVNQHSKLPISDVLSYADNLLKYTIDGDCAKIKETLGDYLSPIPSDLRGDNERYYHVLVFMLLYTAKIHVHSEVHSYKGNADLIIEEEDYVIIIEFKQSNKSSINYMINEALEQIETQEYGRQYKNKNIIKGAIVFKDSEIGCKLIKE
ncbi:ATP-binding protein [Methanobrevibacter filiformis]|uniref:Putative AAA-ATPase n=1 Tax=Methanobrevibacter filiformis TaxID=55758 RepID=A0A166CMB8_9EURY|nr:ATP-binding protein [Methanobrevibacter filiformis]KZX15427.1 putative AAA-ATPase [Methanobrevibacter filiformis]